MYTDTNSKLQADQSYRNADNCGAALDPSYAQAQCAMPKVAYSLRDEAQKLAHHHQEQSDKAARAAAFLHQHPEFDEFIRLVRSGSLQF